MSRSFVRSLAVGALLLAAPAIVEAQGCTVIAPATSCFINRNATLTIPSLAFINITAAGDIALSTPADWAAFLTAGTPVTTVTAAPLTLRSNTTYGVDIAAGAIAGGSRPLGAHGYKFQSGACTAGGFTAFSGATQTFIAAGSAATNGTGANLCLESTFDPSDFVGNLSAGSYTIPLTLTITAP
ncbi:MAG: hypothetical protein KF709_13360 [Gemmatimonadaceae bacterium]|nr:hypothetical protein [Gemmatimonadaceae bacterium]